MSTASMSSGTSSTSDTPGGIRCFSGESEDHKEYRRWKLWLVNKFQTMDKLPKEARGSFLFTCLSGKALETVEHVDPTEYQKADGEKVLLKMLDSRFPERDESDELGEVLNEVFNLRAKEGETLRNWVSRATELFDRCERKSGVKFPEEARGYMLLKWSGYPDFIVGKRRAVALVQDEQDDSPLGDKEVMGFDDIEMFLADHENVADDDSGVEYPEQEVAEVLAATWKEKRAEIARLQKSRRFDQAREAKRSFRVEIEEMKRKTKGNRCGRISHWARECRQKRDATSATGSHSASFSKNASKENAASYVAVEEEIQPSFVASVGVFQTLLQQLQHRRSQAALNSEQHLEPVSTEVLLVSSPGYAVLDSGCGKIIIGERTLEQFQKIWTQDGRFGPEFKTETNVFKFGNGDRETSQKVVIMPIGLAGRFGNVQAAVVKGDAPLLLSRPALKRLVATLDFENDRVKLFSGAVELELKSNAAGQYVLGVLDFPKPDASPEVAMVEAQPLNALMQSTHILGVNGDNHKTGISGDKPHDNDAENNNQESGLVVPAPSSEGVSCPCRSHKSATVESSAHVQPCHAVNSISSSKKAGGITKKQLRKLKKQVKTAVKKPQVGNKYAVVEVFCPPRFVPEVEKLGLRGLSLDIKNGWNLDDPKTQAWVLQEMKDHPPN